MRTHNRIIAGQRLLIILALAISALIASSSIVTATAPIPTYGTATVDGNISEWNLTQDFFAPMYIAADSGKALASNVYLRYDQLTHTVYVLVLQEDSFPIQALTNKAWGDVLRFDDKQGVWKEDYKVYTGDSGNDGTPPDFAWVGLDTATGRAQGYEASFIIAPGTYNVGFHVNVFNIADHGQAASSGTTSLLGNVVLQLETGAQIDVIKYVSTDNTNWVDANTAPGLITTTGTTIYYKFVVTNTGIYPLTSISLIDNLPVTFTTTPPTTLAVGESFTVYTAAVSAVQGSIANIASVSASTTTPFGVVSVVDADPANYTATIYVVPEPPFALAMLSIFAVAAAFMVYKKTRP